MMLLYSPRFIVPVLLMSMAACSTGTGPEAVIDPNVDVELKVEDSLAEFGPASALSEGWISVRLPVTVQNNGATTVRFRRYGSGPNVVERWEKNRWREVWQPVVSYGAPVDVEISPGKERALDLLVQARLGSMPWEWLAPVSGEYRIGMALSAVDRTLEPSTTVDMMQYSEPFRVEER